MSGLQVSGIYRSYDAQTVLRGAELDVPIGAILALLGSSGSGKTTLLRLIAGLDRPERGEIVIGGQLVAGPHVFVPPERRHIGYVPQEGALFPHMSVANNICFGLNAAERKSGRLEEVLRLTGLAGLEQRYPHQLSGGQQQRTALARALAPRPRLVLLDEPFNALDLDLRRAVCADVIGALRAAHATALFVTHDPVEAFSGADLVAVIRKGEIAQVGSPTSLYRTPIDAEVARLTGPAVFLDAIAHNDLAHTIVGNLPLHAGKTRFAGPTIAMLRHEQLAISHDGDGARGMVSAVTFHGDHNLVVVNAGGLSFPVRVTGNAFAKGDHAVVSAQGPCMVYPKD